MTVEDSPLQMGLFDHANLVEVVSSDYPGERLVACRNLELAEYRARRKREALLAATEESLAKIDDANFRYKCDEAAITAEAALDGSMSSGRAWRLTSFLRKTRCAATRP